MATVQKIYEEMQRMAPLELAESWDNPGLLVDCGGEVRRVLVTLDITPEVVEEAARKSRPKRWRRPNRTAASSSSPTTRSSSTR